MSPVPGAALLGAAAAAALLADRLTSIAVVATVLLGVCMSAGRRARLYVAGALISGFGVIVVYPFLAVEGGRALWTGPSLPVLGPLDVTVKELELAAASGLRLMAVGLAFAAFTLLLDHDRLLAALGFARRSTLAVALATRLLPALEQDAAGLLESVRGRGLAVSGARGHARLLSPLVAGSLERAVGLAEAMEARGFGRGGATRAPQPAWSRLDRAALPLAAAIVVVGALWL